MAAVPQSLAPMATDPPLADPPPAPPPWAWSSGWTALWVVILSLGATGGAVVQLGLGDASHGYFLGVVLIGVCFAAASMDAATGRVPNMLTYPAVLLGLAFALIATLLLALHVDLFARWSGAATIASSAGGAGLCLGIGVAGMVAGALGGGDAKLMTAIGAMVGFEPCLPILLNTLVVASLFALLNVLTAGALTVAMRHAACRALSQLVLRSAVVFEPPRRHTIPLAVPILLGVVLTLVVGYDPTVQWTTL